MATDQTKSSNEDTTSQSSNGENQKEKPTGDANLWGYDLYPERKGLFQQSFVKVALMKEGRETYDKIRCEEHVYKCIKSSPLVKLMVGALKSSGWYTNFLIILKFDNIKIKK